MIETAIKANVPIVGVQTDDLINLERVLSHISGRPARRFILGASGGVPQLAPCIYWTDDPKHASTDVFLAFRKNEHTLVMVNCHSHLSVVECGTLDPPAKLVGEFMGENFETPAHAAVGSVMRGLSLRMMDLIVTMTSARVANVTVPELRKTRSLLLGGAQGLEQVDTAQALYVAQKDLSEWVDINAPFFLAGKNKALIPRGLLLDGMSGVGKSSGAKYIAARFGVPLYRLNVAGMLDRYVGSGEKALTRALSLVDREQPCLLLIDEVEKLFSHQDDSGVTERLLSIILWWLAEHDSRVLTIMTSNDKGKLPEELYREERVDKVMTMLPLAHADAVALGLAWAATILGHATDHGQQEASFIYNIRHACHSNPDQMHTSLPDKLIPHSRIRQLVIDTIKKGKFS